MHTITIASWIVLLLTACVGLAASGEPGIAADAGDEIDRLPSIKALPDPLLRSDGARIGRADWPAQRHALLKKVLHWEYGELPPVGSPVQAREVASRPLEAVPGATETEYALSMGPGGLVHTRLVLTVPAGGGRHPVVVDGDMCWARLDPQIVAAVVRRGYAMAEFDRTLVAPDSAERAGVYAAVPDYEGGRLAAWAWGFHRVIDYLMTRHDIDRRRIVVTGHSRGGKAALLAGATDERVALTAPNNSGCGGAGCYRYQAEKSEDIGIILHNFPFWFHPRFAGFIGRIDRLPIDQHTLKALVAPRVLLSTEALGDLWANPEGTQRTHLAAREVYTFLGVANRIGIHFREGGHAHTLDDWMTLLDFADAQLFDRPVTRRFDQMAFPASS